MPGPLGAIRQACAQHIEAARQARNDGKPVVGYLGNAVPVELILAAGCVTVLVTGDPDEEVPLADRFLDDDYDGDMRSVYQRIVSGYFDFVDLIVIPRASNSYLYLYYFLQETRRLLPERHFPDVYLFDLLQTPYWATGQYVYRRIVDLKARLEHLVGQTIDDDAMRAAIASVNRNRRTLQALNDLRRRKPPLVSGSDMLRAIAAAQCMDRDANTALLQEMLAHEPDLSPLGGARLMVKGTPHDNTRLYELVESLGATIVADDHLTGERTIEHLVDEGTDPLTALARHYHLDTPTIRSYPQSAQDQRFIDIVVAAGVEGVIFLHDESDDTLGWDYPAQKKLLDGRGIPSIYLPQQSYRAPDRAAQEASVRAFIERICT
jgi:benzoyl-CoA reductase/2-hydroxyglutaryl-CoA dehydratase subunit BcrC/BadD/HgdB